VTPERKGTARMYPRKNAPPTNPASAPLKPHAARSVGSSAGYAENPVMLSTPEAQTSATRRVPPGDSADTLQCTTSVNSAYKPNATIKLPDTRLIACIHPLLIR
jgi:hypothetical protein